MGLICIRDSSLGPSLSPCKREKGRDEAQPGTDERGKGSLDTLLFRGTKLLMFTFPL